MTNEEILKCAQELFGKDIVKNAYAEDLKDYDKKWDMVTEDDIDVCSLSIIVEFINGKTIKIWSSGSGGVSRY
ncbi:hypothetical protein [Bacillus thuringiensis]|uniref:Uncharacterized protein n=1 Tax=Bacillus thuringiensis TaxID=1428 RepID=A0A9X6WI54_BACTU|nr:hypothetical protein [Bacillus thuringiensis]PFJ32328.1 hypothetical protein COJ15_29095 [Bacillus thuringiensis]